MSLRIFTVIALFVTLFIIGLWCDYQQSLQKVVSHQTVELEIERGDSFKIILKKLSERDIQINHKWFQLYAYLNNQAHKVKAGEFVIPAGLTPPQLLNILVAGKVKAYSITFPEGWTFKQILQKLANAEQIHHTLTGFDELAILKQIGVEEEHPEGLFFPDTYRYEKNTSDMEILKRAYKKMQTILAEAWPQRQDDLPFTTAYEALILASIVEKETGQADERAQIAGVFIRRLRKGMMLQSDPTIIYGMGDAYHGNIRSKDIRAKTAYNTYVIEGLPPTPIAMPGKQAIHAVMHPAPGKALFFVAKGDGGHYFSETLRAHNNAVNKYQRRN